MFLHLAGVFCGCLHCFDRAQLVCVVCYLLSHLPSGATTKLLPTPSSPPSPLPSPRVVFAQDLASLKAALSNHLAENTTERAQDRAGVSGGSRDASWTAPQVRRILSQGTAFITDSSATDQACAIRLFVCSRHRTFSRSIASS